MKDQLLVAGIFVLLIIIGWQLFRIHREDTQRELRHWDD